MNRKQSALTLHGQPSQDIEIHIIITTQTKKEKKNIEEPNHLPFNFTYFALTAIIYGASVREFGLKFII